MLIIITNRNRGNQVITVHTGKAVELKENATLVVACGQERFPYYATLRNFGYDIRVENDFWVIDPIVTSTAPVVEETPINDVVEESTSIEPADEVAEIEAVEDTPETIVTDEVVEEVTNPEQVELVNETTSVSETEEAVVETSTTKHTTKKSTKTTK